MEKTYEKTMNFLLYSYFGIEDFDKIKGDIEKSKEACAKRAYLDLARTIKYTKTTSDLEKEPKEEAENYNKAKADLKSEVCGKIIEKIEECSERDFTQKHERICNEIVGKMNGSHLLKENFTYGQAQKWLNMTLKYYWLLGLLPESIKKSDLHVPIDSYIIEAVQSPRDKIEYGLNMKTELTSDPWSKMSDYDKYSDVQQKMKDVIENTYNICPIEWENKAWIEVAKYRANQ